MARSPKLQFFNAPSFSDVTSQNRVAQYGFQQAIKNARQAGDSFSDYGTVKANEAERIIQARRNQAAADLQRDAIGMAPDEFTQGIGSGDIGSNAFLQASDLTTAQEGNATALDNRVAGTRYDQSLKAIQAQGRVRDALGGMQELRGEAENRANRYKAMYASGDMTELEFTEAMQNDEAIQAYNQAERGVGAARQEVGTYMTGGGRRGSLGSTGGSGGQVGMPSTGLLSDDEIGTATVRREKTLNDRAKQAVKSQFGNAILEQGEGHKNVLTDQLRAGEITEDQYNRRLSYIKSARGRGTLDPEMGKKITLPGTGRSDPNIEVDLESSSIQSGANRAFGDEVTGLSQDYKLSEMVIPEVMAFTQDVMDPALKEAGIDQNTHAVGLFQFQPATLQEEAEILAKKRGVAVEDLVFDAETQMALGEQYFKKRMKWLEGMGSIEEKIESLRNGWEGLSEEDARSIIENNEGFNTAAPKILRGEHSNIEGGFRDAFVEQESEESSNDQGSGIDLTPQQALNNSEQVSGNLGDLISQTRDRMDSSNQSALSLLDAAKSNQSSKSDAHAAKEFIEGYALTPGNEDIDNFARNATGAVVNQYKKVSDIFEKQQRKALKKLDKSIKSGGLNANEMKAAKRLRDKIKNRELGDGLKRAIAESNIQGDTWSTVEDGDTGMSLMEDKVTSTIQRYLEGDLERSAQIQRNQNSNVESLENLQERFDNTVGKVRSHGEAYLDSNAGRRLLKNLRTVVGKVNSTRSETIKGENNPTTTDEISSVIELFNEDGPENNSRRKGTAIGSPGTLGAGR